MARVDKDLGWDSLREELAERADVVAKVYYLVLRNCDGQAFVWKVEFCQ